MKLTREAVNAPLEAGARVPSRSKALWLLSMTATAIAMASVPVGAASAASPSVTYYVSLGDSLASGYQPNSGHDTKIAYTDKLFEQLKQRNPGLQHIRLGCTGETSTSMVNGGKCLYPGAKSQLEAAVKFLGSHRGQVKYLTLDIGANDVDSCVSANGSIDPACAQKGIATLAQAMPKITGTLQQAGGAQTSAGMTYYNPFLALWLKGDAGKQAAKASAQLQVQTNNILVQGYTAVGFRVADVAGAFSSSDFSTQVQLPQIGAVPVNVARVCQLTWACTPYQDIHTNEAGHQAIAAAFACVLTRNEGRPTASSSASPSHATQVGVTQAAPAKPTAPPSQAASLAFTGSSRSTPVIAGAGCAVAAAGASILIATRRRRTRRH
ncbi:SGNH/GDSL hydrolase family protein [Kitasatospora sp. NPDC059571]|uniref:SGNH/GDSL hydrolase family protein n=1 Tax=Kitasatospora sp. NPDC059571 TaxID=3346871 RepID=UPI0036D064DA